MNVCQALCILKTAIKNVKPCYVKIEVPPKSKIKKEQVERSFAYELYHQWSLLLEDQEWTSNSRNLRLNGEITKIIHPGCKVFPDMILHGGQENFDNQLMVCEIKRNDKYYLVKKKILNDFKKLSKFLKLRHPDGVDQNDAAFKCAVFIVANISEIDLQQRIRKALEGESEILRNRDKIHCFSAEYVNDVQLIVNHFTLTEVFPPE